MNNAFRDLFPHAEEFQHTCFNVIFVTQQGSSVIYTGLLDKSTVLKTKQQEPVLDYNHHQRLVGGKLSNLGLNALHNVLKYHGKKNKSDGGAMSAGAMSGGAHHNRLSRHLK